MAYTEEELKKELETKEYAYGFYTDIESDTFPKGLSEEIVVAISRKKEEPQWMTDWRLEAYRAWQQMEEPEWANVHYTKPNFQDISYYSAPNKKPKYNSIDEVDPELLDTFKRLGISLDEQKKTSRGSGRYRDGLRVCGDDLQKNPSGERHYFLLHLRGDQRTP